MIRDENCSKCKLGNLAAAGKVCILAKPVTSKTDILIVTRNPLSDRARADLDVYLLQAGIHPSRVAVTGATKCSVWGVDPSKIDIKACSAAYLTQEVDELKPKVVVAMGNEALLATLGRSGIMKYRSRTHEWRGTKVIPTVSPSMVKRNPGQEAGFIADLQFIQRAADGQAAPTAPPASIRYVTSGAGVEALTEALRGCYGAYFDIETTGFDEWQPDSRIVSISFTTWSSRDSIGPEECWVLPLYHPESPFKGFWREVFAKLRGVLDGKKVVAHNGKFDARWTRQFGVPFTLTFDTMLAAHVLNENRPKGLKPLAQALLGVEPWGIDTKDLLNTPLKKVVRYNALDTWWGAHLYFVLRRQLAEQPRLARIAQGLLVPASNELVSVEMAGIWTDREQLATNKAIAEKTLAEIEEKLLAQIPPPEEWPPEINEVNFNRSNFMMWLLFEFYKFPVLARGKTREDGSPGNPSMAEAVLQRYEQMFPENPLPKLLLERTGWYKNLTAFLSAYSEQIDDQDRIHTTFKLHGTVTGRLSSGKNDEEKVTARVQNRGVNLQQVPRDSFIRGLFGAPPGWVFVECDYSQVELRIAAFIAQEPTMIRLYALSEDIHTRMAQKMTGRLDVTKDQRKKAKAVNFGFLYGMGWRKFIETAWSNYGVVVTEAEAQLFRRLFFEEFPMLVQWHSRQRRLAEQFKRVESPLGRVRHLPDIDSPDGDVRSEAQRQSINSPVQSMASDMCLMSFVIISKKLREMGLRAHSVGTVHDAINFEIPEEEVPIVVPMIRHVMENLPLEKYFGVSLNIPIIGDVKIGRRWGGAQEIPSDVSSSHDALKKWMDEYVAL